MSKFWWLALGLIIVAFTFEGAKREGGWLLVFLVLSMLFLAKQKGMV